jgi:translocation and assembly module TamA
LDKKSHPIGGLSMMIYNLELRWRINQTFGAVFFYDIGNTYAAPIPRIKYRQLQSVGIGARYHTPVGPLRLDIAFPLNRRHMYNGKYLDHRFEIYLSMGHTF